MSPDCILFSLSSALYLPVRGWMMAGTWNMHLNETSAAQRSADNPQSKILMTDVIPGTILLSFILSEKER